MVVNSNYNVSTFVHTQNLFSKLNCLFVNNIHESWLWQESKECWNLRNSYIFHYICFLKQRFSTFLAPGTDFMEDNFSKDGGWRVCVCVEMVSGCVKHTTFIVHFASIIITSAPLRSSGTRSWRLGTPVLQFRLKPCVPSSPSPGHATLMVLQNSGRVVGGGSHSLCEESEPWGWEQIPGTLITRKSCHYGSEVLELYDTSCSTLASCEVGVPLDSPSCRDLFSTVSPWSCGSC